MKMKHEPLPRITGDTANESHDRVPHIVRPVFRNWAGTFLCRPEYYFQPRNIDEVKEVVAMARMNQKKISTVGSGHSPGDITCTNDYMVNLDHMARLLSIDEMRKLVRVEAGMRLHDLHKHLAAHGLALPNLGSISDQSVAGFMGTATHGSSLHHTILSKVVREVRIVLADGSVRDCSWECDRELFRAALVHLGALGIIVEVTLECGEAFLIKSRQRIQSITDTIRSWKEDRLWGSAEFVRVWWYPYTQKTVIWQGDRVGLEQPTELHESWYRDVLWTYHLQQAFLAIGRHIPSLGPRIEKAVFQAHYGADEPHVITSVNKSVNALNMNCLYSQYVNEWAIPLECGPEACERLNLWLHGNEVAAKIPFSSAGVFVHAPIEIRVAAQQNDDAFLSPTTQGPVCYIGVIMYRPYSMNTAYRRYFRAYEWLMRSLGGRPHWAKDFAMSSKELHVLYPAMSRWLMVRDRVDPQRLFSREYHERHILSLEKTVEPRKFKARL